MVEWIKDRFDIVRNNKLYNSITTFLFPAILIVFSFCKVNKGLDITDSSYSLSNFRNLNSLDGMWLFSTFYANLIGGLMNKLPGGATMLGMSFYTCMVKCALGLLSYFFYSYEVKLSRFYAFLCAMISLGLCWCPTTILYNYLTYLFFGMGIVLLYKGITYESNLKLLLAGFMLGSNVFVRLPNLVEAGMIVVLWAYSAMNKVRFKDGLFRTLICMVGYALSLIPAFAGIMAFGGINAYVNGIRELMSMTSEASDYSTTGMLLALVRSYWNGRQAVLIFVAFALGAYAVYKLTYRKNRYLAEVFSFALGIISLVILYKMGSITRSYSTYSAIYGIGKLSVTVIMIFLVIKVFDRNLEAKAKLTIMLALMAGVITPIGSNNDVYSVFNNLFFILPAVAMILSSFKPRTQSLSAVYIMLITLMMGLAFQSICFGARFVFRDGQTVPMQSYVQNNSVVAHMLTNEENARRLTEVSDLWKEKSLSNQEVLLYGDVSGLGYYLDSDIAISTAWPSLASYSTEKFERDIEGLRQEEKTPVVLISNAEYDNLMYNCNLKKQEILKEYLLNYNYKIIYDNDVFKVMLAQ